MVAPIGALNIFMFIVALLCILVGFFGYLKYGDSTAASITLNLPRGQPLAEVEIYPAFSLVQNFRVLKYFHGVAPNRFFLCIETMHSQ